MWTITPSPFQYNKGRTVIKMSWSIQVTNFNVKSLNNNANINFGPTYQNSHTANSKIIGGNYSFGDHSLIISNQKNLNQGGLKED
jgi:hypothetical protein